MCIDTAKLYHCTDTSRFFSILEVGPSLDLNAQAIATLDLDVDLQVGLKYNVENLELFFPPLPGRDSFANVAAQDSRKSHLPLYLYAQKPDFG